MAIISRAALKLRFENGDVPSATDFIDLIDSMFALGDGPPANTQSTVQADYLINQAMGQLIGPHTGVNGGDLCRLAGAAYIAEYPKAWSQIIIQAEMLGYTLVDISFTLPRKSVVNYGAQFGGTVNGAPVAYIKTDPALILVAGSYLQGNTGLVAASSVQGSIILPAGAYRLYIDPFTSGISIKSVAANAIFVDYV